MQETYQKQSKAKLIAACTAIILVVGLVLVIDHLKNKPATSVAATTTNTSSTTAPTDTTTPATQPTPDTSSTPAAPSSAYKDGTYSASSQYFVPHGYENIQVTLTVKGDTVTDSRIVNSEGDPDSASFQEAFASEYKSQVVGKKLSEIHLSFVAGASDTTDGFNDAVSQIETKAQA